MSGGVGKRTDPFHRGCPIYEDRAALASLTRCFETLGLFLENPAALEVTLFIQAQANADCSCLSVVGGSIPDRYRRQLPHEWQLTITKVEVEQSIQHSLSNI